MANPRKFSEKIALQKQKQAEGTAEFEKIMNEVKATRVVDGTLGNTDLTDVSILHRNASLSGGSGGSGTSSGASGGGASPDTNAGGGIGGGGGGVGMGINVTVGSPTAYRESRGRSVGVGPMRRPSERKQDRSPYGSTASGLMLSGMTPTTQNSYLSPPIDTSWRRSNSDSALHQTLNMAEGNFATSSPVPSMMSDLNSLHANYHHHHHNQRSHSPNIGRSYSPQAQRRKNTLLQQQQQQQQQLQQQQQNHHQQQQLQHQRLQMQQAQHQQQQQQHHHQQQQQLQQHLQNQQQTLQQQHQLHQQQQQYNAKFNNSNIMFKSLQEQQLGFNNTGSLPDLTSVHYGTQTNSTQMMQPSSQQQQQQQQQQTLSPVLSPHHNNGCNDRDQSPSPFSPPSTGGSGSGGGGPPSPYHQQQNSPTSAANTPALNAQTSPHLSFTNLSVQSPVSVQQTTAQNTAAAFSTLPTLGAASSTGNLTDYRQPLNPPSPGSSPGLLTSGPATELHTSAPPSPIRHCQNNISTTGSGTASGTQVGGQPSQQQQQQQIPIQSLQNAFGPIDSNTGYNTLNPAFHNHFEQFHLGDNSHSPQNNYDALEFEDFGAVTSSGNQQHNTFNNKIIDFGDLTSTSSSSSNNTRTNTTNTTTNCNNNNNNLPGVQHQQQRNNSQQFQQQQQHLNNNSNTNTSSTNTHTNGPLTCRTHNTGLMNNNDRQDILSPNSSPIPSPISHCVPSPSSPLPIPMSAHSPTQQLSLSVQTSPHHSPMHSPHHSPSPLSVSSPGLTILGGSISPVPSPSAHIMQHQQQQQHNHINNQTATQMNLNHQNQTSHANISHQQTHTHSTTTTNIPQIIFSDYSSSRDIFDHLDLDLGQIDEPGLQMLSDQNPIMIADPSIEDSFRRDLN